MTTALDHLAGATVLARAALGIALHGLKRPGAAFRCDPKGRVHGL